MAGLRVELLVLLAGALLLVSVQGWERVNETQLFSLYGTGQWGRPVSVPPPDKDDDYDDYGEDEITEGVVFDVASSSDNFNPFSDHGFNVEGGLSGPRNWVSSTDGGFQVEFVDTPPRSWTSSTDGEFEEEFVDAPPRSWTSSTNWGSTGLDVVCSKAGFEITLPTDNLNEVKVLGSKDLVPVIDAPESCGYDVNHFKNTVTIPFSGCNVKYLFQTNSYSLQLLYIDGNGQTQVATASCEESSKKFGLIPRSSDRPKPKTKCNNSTTTPSKAQNCAVVMGEKITCGHAGISSSECEKMGCCVDSYTFACYYPMDECTADQHFVFAIRFDSTSIPVDTTKLVIPRSPNCVPVIVNDKVAIFKFKVTECGVRAYDVGETKIYLAEVHTIVQALNLKYGIITRTDPLRFMVECRYSKDGIAQQALASAGYMVKSPSIGLPSAVTADGLYGVQLRIATDKTYSNYFDTYHQPLRLLLGKPVYLELRLKSPKPDAVILVNYCLAYPRSAKNALVLIYEGCANPYDPNVSILKVSDPSNRHQRRFVVSAFQFMDQKTNKYLDEEIYFMCSSEVCRPAEKMCEQRCFDGKAL